MSNYTVPNFTGDDYDDDEPLQKLTPAQIAARDAEWPMFADTDQINRADVAAVLTELRDALAKDRLHGAVGRLQAAMYQLGVQY